MKDLEYCPFCDRKLKPSKSYSNLIIFCQECPVVYYFNFNPNHPNDFSIGADSKAFPNINHHDRELGWIINKENELSLTEHISFSQILLPPVERTKENILQAYADFCKLIKLQAFL
jgi:hypothetical protein